MAGKGFSFWVWLDNIIDLVKKYILALLELLVVGTLCLTGTHRGDKSPTLPAGWLHTRGPSAPTLLLLLCLQVYNGLHQQGEGTGHLEH